MKNTFVEWTTTTNKNISRPVVGRICSTVVEHTPRHLKVVATYPAGCWAFSSSSSFDFFSLSLPTFLYQWSVLNHVPQRDAFLTGWLWKKHKKWMPPELPETGSLSSDWVFKKTMNKFFDWQSAEPLSRFFRGNLKNEIRKRQWEWEVTNFITMYHNCLLDIQVSGQSSRSHNYVQLHLRGTDV